MSNNSSSMQHPLASRSFFWLWLGQAISTFGNRFTTVAVPLFIYQLTGSSLQLSIAFITQVVAALLFGLVAGAYADRWNRQRTMLICDLIRGTLITLIPLSLLFNLDTSTQVWLVYLISFLVAAIGQFFAPSKISLIPQTVEKEKLVVANSLDQGTNNFMQFIGYSLAGILIATVGVSMAFLIDAATFVVSAVCIAMIRVDEKAAQEREGSSAEITRIFTSIREGINRMWADSKLRWLLGISLLAPVGIGATLPLTVIFVQDELGLDEGAYGFWQAAVALGVAFGVLWIGRRFPDAKRTNLIICGVIGFGLFQAVAIMTSLGLIQNELLAGSRILFITLPIIVLMAMANGSIFLGLRTMIQENTPNAMIGRVFSAISVVSSLAMVIGQVSAGLADWFGASTLLIFWSLFMISIGVGAYLLENRTSTTSMDNQVISAQPQD